MTKRDYSCVVCGIKLGKDTAPVCKTCVTVLYERDGDLGYIYFIRESRSNLYKIGRSTENNIGTRLIQLQIGNPRELTLYKTFLVKNAQLTEKALHWIYATSYIRGEWFKLPVEFSPTQDRIMATSYAFIRFSLKGG